jgi:Ion channel
MMESHQFAIVLPLIVGAMVVECTIFVHVLAFAATVNLLRLEKRRGHLGTDAVSDVLIIATVASVAFAAHLIEIGLWGVLFVLCGEFHELGSAFYHSAVNYTTLGYGDLLLSPAWRLLGPLEATNGALMFGVSAAMVFAAVQRLALARFEDLRG